MIGKLLEVMLSLVLGFFTGIWLSGNGIHIQESGVQILLGCILWISIFAYLKMNAKP
ncbi:hypothetical protein [Paenibacillus antarcticus]|uniref:hypothetical protein n=1 Tax=Paenibacillus antarcticus TaxID=253703 RepID=UPI000AB23D12|nr:hypothetical protein [Paenibacillus antarcticus]